MEAAAATDEVRFDSSFGQEAQEWLSTVYAAMEKMPAGRLFALLKPEMTVLNGHCRILCSAVWLDSDVVLYLLTAGAACQPGQNLHRGGTQQPINSTTVV